MYSTSPKPLANHCSILPPPMYEGKVVFLQVSAHKNESAGIDRISKTTQHPLRECERRRGLLLASLLLET